MKTKKILFGITFFIIIVSSLFFIPIRQYGVVMSPGSSSIDLEKYDDNGYYHIYSLPSNESKSIKSSGQLNFVDVEIKHSVIYEELAIRYIIIILLVTAFYLLFLKNKTKSNFCENCNKPIDKDSKYCKYCGTEIETNDPEFLKGLLKEMAEDTASNMKINDIIKNKTINFETYGLVKEDPIFTCMVDGSEKYLSNLMTDKCEPLTYKRIASTSSSNITGMTDIYELYLDNKIYKTIYINMYSSENSRIAPKGLLLKTQTNKTNKTI